MTSITQNQWTLHYTIGRVLAAKVKPGDVVHMPGGRGYLIVLGGRAPLRANDRGSVSVRDALAEGSDGFETRPGAVGMVWISDAVAGRNYRRDRAFLTCAKSRRLCGWVTSIANNPGGKSSGQWASGRMIRPASC